MVMLTRGVCRAIPRFFAIALAEVTTPLAMRPSPRSFSLAKTKMVSPLAMCLPPYIVFCPLNANRSEEHTSELQSLRQLVCRLLLEKKKYNRCFDLSNNVFRKCSVFHFDTARLYVDVMNIIRNYGNCKLHTSRKASHSHSDQRTMNT